MRASDRVRAVLDQKNWALLASYYGAQYPSDAAIELTARLLKESEARGVVCEVHYSASLGGVALISPDWETWFQNDNSLGLIVMQPRAKGGPLRTAIFRDYDDFTWPIEGTFNELVDTFSEALKL